MKRLFLLMSLALLPLSTSLSAREPIASKKAALEFNRDIRPILSDACFHCHGPDKAKRKGDLRLDTEAGGKSVVVPGKPGESELVKRILSHDKSEVMPPPKSGRQLTPAQIAILQRWVAEGAAWQPHWAFIPPRRPPATARPPTDRERIILGRAYNRLLKQYRDDHASARQLISAGESASDPTADVAELAANAAVASLILNLDEVITRE